MNCKSRETVSLICDKDGLPKDREGETAAEEMQGACCASKERGFARLDLIKLCQGGELGSSWGSKRDRLDHLLLAGSCLHLQVRFSSKKASHESFLSMLEMQTRNLACRQHVGRRM